jgi:glycosyltransferase involved in cell wall biosynthesis
MKILALTKYHDDAASTRHRLTQYLPYLESNGLHIECAPMLDAEYITRFANNVKTSPEFIIRAYWRRLIDIWRAKSFDAIWVQYETLPYLPGVFERLISISNPVIICDYDDAIFHQYDTNKNVLVRRLLRQKLAPLLRHASLCICGNAYLQKYAAQYCKNTIIIPTVVDTDRYRPAPRKQGTELIVGWIGSPSTWFYVVPILDDLLPFLASNGARLKVVGAGPQARNWPSVEVVDWSEKTEVREVQSFDIGIMPLPDDQWARGKCGYKLIQYMACGIPVIASPVGVNNDIVDEGKNGFLAGDFTEWRAALHKLLTNSNLRQELGKNGHKKVVQHYSLNSQQPVLLTALSEMDKNNQSL